MIWRRRQSQDDLHFAENSQDKNNAKDSVKLGRQGIGFLEAGYFCPDFIIWLLAGGNQYVFSLIHNPYKQEGGIMDNRFRLAMVNSRIR